VVEVGVVVDVEPVTACTGGLFGGAADQACADTSPLTGEVDERIQDEGVNASVPAELDEAEELISFEGSDPGRTVRVQLFFPWSADSTAPSTSKRV
jgi:hypothetical protein